ncbi:MAG TPA: hypothetical protein VFV92_11385 [Candidatus Bathyarchaeia archaeon]|nr:hypothetical protein [Candidatus Bathyarchaeia archaeon]
MKLASPFVGFLTIVLLIAIPVGGSPSLQVGSHSTYNLNATLSFQPPICQTDPSTATAMMVICPTGSMIPEIPSGVNVTGTLGWTDTGLNSTFTTLNVTHDLTTSSNGLMVPSIHRAGSFNETINLANRTISIIPFLRTEMDDALQMDQAMMSTSIPSGISPSTAMSTIESNMFQPHPVYTMWWVNDASSLKLNQTVPVLFFPTNVTGSTSIDLGSLGSRQAWTLTFSPRPFSMLDLSTTAGTTNSRFGVTFTFNYDQKSGVLLSANVNIHFGFSEQITQSSECSTSNNPPIGWCNNGSLILSSSGFNFDATLTLASTSLNLDQTMGSGGASEGSTTASTGTGSGTGGNGSGSGSGSGTGQSSTSGSQTGSGTGSGSSAGNTPAPSSPQPMVTIAPWIYLLLGLVVVAIISTGLWIARRRSRKPSSPTQQ